MAEVWRYFSHEDDYADLDEAACCERMAGTLRFRTIDRAAAGDTDEAEFARLRAYLAEQFPLVFSTGEVELVGRSLLVTIPGSDASLRPMQLMGHQDVVPVVEGTEGDWTHDAFSGFVDDTYVWGRGSVDMKCMVAGELEACEYALAHGWGLRRTVILCLGQDEETFQGGARSLGRLLLERGIRPEFLVDEGDYLISVGSALDAPDLRMMNVGLAEKGYCDVELVVRSVGGHSSNPFGGSSLATLAAAVDRIASAGWGDRVVPLMAERLAQVAPHMRAGRLAELASGGRDAIAANADAIAAELASRRDTFPLVTTTVAPTMVSGGAQAPNVLPQDMFANVNFRLLAGTTCDEVLARCRELVDGLDVEVRLVPESANDPSAASVADGSGMGLLRSVAARYFRVPETGEPVELVPTFQVGATDARMYECVCDQCLRFSAFVVDAEESERGVHGTDERITRRAYMQGVRFMIRLIEEACVRP